MPEFREAIDKFNGLTVLVVGDIMLDHYTFGSVERISPEAPIPIIRKSSEKFTLGGAGNVANNLAALGASVPLAGVIGNDEAGQRVMSILKEKGINTDAVVVLPHRSTTEKHRIVSGESHQLLRLDREESDHLTAEEEDRCYALLVSLVKQCDAIIFSDYAKGFFSENFAQKIIALAKAKGKTMLADFNPRNKKYFLGVDIITPNLKEARELTGLHDVEAIGPRLVRDFGVHAVVTRGGGGDVALPPGRWIAPPRAGKEDTGVRRFGRRGYFHRRPRARRGERARYHGRHDARKRSGHDRGPKARHRNPFS